MEVPVKNIVEKVDLAPSDALLPILECVSNSIISLMQTEIPLVEKQINVEIIRGEPPTQMSLEGINTIKSVVVSDNGIGFNEENYKSFETPHSNIRKQYGCIGVGRFTILASFSKVKVSSNYANNGNWKYREFDFDQDSEITPIKHSDSDIKRLQTRVEMIGCFNPIVKDRTAVSLDVIAERIMHHFLIYYLNGDLPMINIFESDRSEQRVVNKLFEIVSKERERSFEVGGKSFKAYITKEQKHGNRKNHYAHYCANSRVVGQPKNIGRLNSLFSYPMMHQGNEFFLDVYVVSEYLNQKVLSARNAFNIPQEKDPTWFGNTSDGICFDEIEKELGNVLEDEYNDHIRLTRERSVNEYREYIKVNPRFNSLLKNEDVLKSLPANANDDKKEEYLHKVAHHERKKVENSIQDFIANKQVNEESIQAIIQDFRNKSAFDADSLADYMMRRKAVVELFDKFLEADSQGKYKLEEDIHNLIFPMGLTADDLNYEAHNLWLLDERLVTYHFIASDKPITSFSQKPSRKEPDVVMIADPQMFDNPMGFGDKSNGDISSIVVFEFKRPGESASTKSKGNYLWEFSELTDKYFNDFLYTPDKKNYKGKHVVLRKTTPKFSYIILDVIPVELEDFNKDRGWCETPFGSFYKMQAGINLHVEVMTFTKLIEHAKQRHNPFFDRLFSA